MRASLRRRIGDSAAGLLSYFPEGLRRHVPRVKLDWKDEDEEQVAHARSGAVRLLIGPANFAGQGYQWARAAEILPGVSAVSLERVKPDEGFYFDSDYRVHAAVADFSRRWASRQRYAVSGFTHVLIEAGIPLYSSARRELLATHVRELQRMGLVVGLIWHGSDVRTPVRHAELESGSPLGDLSDPINHTLQSRALENHRSADEVAVAEFVSTPDLLEFRPRATWLPTVVDETWANESMEPKSAPVPVVLHAPSKARLKGTERIRLAARTLEQEGIIEYREVTGVSHKELLEMIRQADIVVDSLGLGSYGVVSIEAMLSGRVAVANVWGSVRKRVLADTGFEVPVVQASLQTVEEVLRSLASDDERRRTLGTQGMKFARSVHSFDHASQVLESFLFPESRKNPPLDNDQPLKAQIIIPVHDATRPVSRAVQSVLGTPDAGVIVVAHGLTRNDLELPDDERIRVIEVDHGQGLPGVAFNAGLNAANAPWLGIMGSDDWYEEGALDAMLAHLHEDSADAIIAPLRPAQASGNSLKPVTWRRRRLNADRHRLFYRTAPLGLFRRELLQNPRYQMAEHVVAGVDQLSSVRLWTDGLSVSYYPRDPAYVVGDDARQRVTLTPRPLAVQAAMWREVWDDPGVRALPARTKRALADKVIRVHIFDTIQARQETEDWATQDFPWLSKFARALSREVPDWAKALSQSEMAVFGALVRGDRMATEAAWNKLAIQKQTLPELLQGLIEPNSGLRMKIAATVSGVRNRTEDCIDSFQSWSHDRIDNHAPGPGATVIKVHREDDSASDSVPRMLFHAPFPVLDGATSASGIRPWTMLQTFRELGYDVFEITGYAKERRRRFSELRDRMDSGWYPEFAYSETATIPSSFTERHHVPLIPNLERNLFRFLHQNKVPTGVFYRDVYWVFGDYKQRLGEVVAWAMRRLYRRELTTFRRYADVVFLPSIRMAPFVPGLAGTRIEELPPGCHPQKEVTHVQAKDKENLNLLYVGSVGNHYDISLLIRAVQNSENVNLTVCTHEKQWHSFVAEHQIAEHGRIRVLHATGPALEDLYSDADVACIVVDPRGYWDFAVPVKFYEYLGHGTPVLASNGTYVAEEVRDRGVGWIVEYAEEAIERCLQELLKHPEDVEAKAQRARVVGLDNTWKDRARAVREVLSGTKGQ